MVRELKRFKMEEANGLLIHFENKNKHFGLGFRGAEKATR